MMSKGNQMLNKSDFESALQSDMASLGNPVVGSQPGQKNLFGAPQNIMGAPTIPSQPVPQNKEKTKRELLWEQKLAARKSGGQGGGSFLDQMNPKSRAGLISSSKNVAAPSNQGFQKATAVNQTMAVVEVPREAPQQVERPQEQPQWEEPQNMPPPVPSYQQPIQQQAPVQMPPVNQGNTVWDQIGNQPQQPQEFERIQTPVQIQPHPQREPVRESQPAGPSSSAAKSFENQYQQMFKQDQSNLNMPEHLRPEPAPVQDFPVLRIRTPQQTPPQQPIQQQSFEQQYEQPPMQQPQQIEERPVGTPAYLQHHVPQQQQRIQHTPPQPLYQQQRQPSRQDDLPRVSATPPYLQHHQQNQQQQRIQHTPPQPTYQKPEQPAYAPQGGDPFPGMGQQQQPGSRQNRGQQPNTYLNEWQQQIKEKEERKRLEKEKERELGRKELQEQMSYNPYGRGGAGAPLNGNEAPRPQIQIQHQELAPYQPSSQQVAPPQPASRIQRPENNVGGGGNFTIGNDPDIVKNHEEEKKKIMMNELQRQMEEVQRRKDDEKARIKAEEAKEEARLKKERDEMEQAFKKEEEAKQEKVNAVKRANAELMADKESKKAGGLSEENFIVEKKSTKRNSARPPPSDDPFMNAPHQQQAAQPFGGFQSANQVNVPMHLQSSHDGSSMLNSEDDVTGNFAPMNPMAQMSQQVPQLNLPQQTPPGPQFDQSAMVREISANLQNGFKEQITQLKAQMEQQQMNFQSQLQQLQLESANVVNQKINAEGELRKMREELEQQREIEMEQTSRRMAELQEKAELPIWQQQDKALAQMPIPQVKTDFYGTDKKEEAIKVNDYLNTASFKRESRESSASQRAAQNRVSSRDSMRREKNQQVERMFLNNNAKPPVNHNKQAHPKDLQYVSFGSNNLGDESGTIGGDPFGGHALKNQRGSEASMLDGESHMLPISSNRIPSGKMLSSKPPIPRAPKQSPQVPQLKSIPETSFKGAIDQDAAFLGRHQIDDSTLDFFNNLSNTKRTDVAGGNLGSYVLGSERKHAERLDTDGLGGFDFPAIPEYDGIQPDYLKKMPSIQTPKGPGGFKGDPNATHISTASVNSVNLERINRRNADRLNKLDSDNLDDSAFLIEKIKQRNDYLKPTSSQSKRGQYTMDQDMPAPTQAGNSNDELHKLDDMLADILRN